MGICIYYVLTVRVWTRQSGQKPTLLSIDLGELSMKVLVYYSFIEVLVVNVLIDLYTEAIMYYNVQGEMLKYQNGLLS